LNIRQPINKDHTLTGFAYGLDFSDQSAFALSSNTVGVRYQGNFSGFKVLASLARQSDTGNNPVKYSANYALMELSGKLSPSVNWTAGHEILGSDEGAKAFNTPLATLHKFQGFADKFLGTPADGLRDSYLGLGVKVGDAKVKMTYHYFNSDEGGDKLGSEWDLALVYPLTKHLKALVKYADYQADEHASDTQKFHVQLQLAL